jgi:translocation and assembly module TamB
MKRFVLVVMAVAVCVAAILWIGRQRWQGVLRAHVEQALSSVVGAPVRIGSLAVDDIVPLRIAAREIEIGEAPMLAQIDRVEIEIFAADSFRQGRIVLAAEVEGPSFDLTHGVPKADADHEPSAGTLQLPVLQLRSLVVRDLRMQFPMNPKSTASLVVDRVAASATTAAHSAAGTVEVIGVELEHMKYHARLHHVQASGGWGTQGLFVQHASVEGEAINGTVEEASGGHRATVDFDPGLLGVVVDELAEVGGQAHVEGMLDGDLANPVVDAQLRISDGALAGRLLGDLATRFRRRGARLEFDDVVLRGPTGEASGSVDLTILHEVPINADIVARDVDLGGVLALAGEPLPFAVRLDGTVSLRGALDPLDLGVDGKGEASAAESSGKPIVSWRATTRFKPHSVSIEARTEQVEGNRATASLLIDKTSFDGHATLQAADLRPLNALLPTPVGRLAMSGRADASVVFSGTTEHPQVSARLTTQDLTVMGSRVPRLEGGIEIARGSMTAKAVQVDSVGGSMRLTGVVALNADVENDNVLALRNFDADILTSFLQSASGVRLPLSGGVVDGSARTQGKWARLGADTSITVTGARLFGEPLQQISATGRVTGTKWQAQLHAIHTATERVAIDADGDGATQSRISIESTAIDLGHLLGAGRRGLAGSIVVAGHLNGPLARIEGHVDLTAKDIAVQERSVGDIRLRADGSGGKWELTAQGLYDSLSLHADVSLEGAKPYTLTGQWTKSELTAFVGVDPALRLWSSGRVDLNGVLSAAADVRGSIQISELDLSRDAYHLQAVRPIRVTAAGGRFTVESLELAAAESRITGRGTMTTDGAFDLQANGAGDLVLLELLGPPVEAARGPFSIAASLHRESGGPWRLAGTAVAHEASLDMGLPVAFTKVSTEIRFVGSKIYVDELSGRAGGGQFRFAGAVDLVNGPDLSWILENVSFSADRGLEARVAGHGRVDGHWGAVKVEGDVEVLSALYDRDLGLAELLDWLKEQLLSVPRARTQAASGVIFDLRIYSHGGVYLDNNVAKGEMWVNLLLAGDAAKPLLTGTIGILDGEVNVRGRKFLVTGGSIDFSDPRRINPTLNITAESRITTPDSDYLLSVTVTGSADKPRVVFTADDPSLSQNDVLSLVALGRTRAQLQRESKGVSPADALALLPTSAVGNRVGQLVGIDELEVTAAQSRDTGAIEPRVTIGKDLTEQLHALAWTEFGIVARHAVQLEYRLTRRVSLLGSWESQTQSNAGAFGGDVKFRFDFRRVPFTLWQSEKTRAPIDHVN